MITSDEPKKLSAQEVLTRFRRREIIDAAYELAHKEGFSHLTMEKVAEQAGVAKGTIYTYFKDKAELIEVMVHDIGEEVLLDARESTKHEGTARERMLHFVKTLAANMEKHFELFLYVHQPNDSYSKGYPCDEECGQMQSHKFIALFAEVIATGVERGELRKVDPTTVSYFLLSSVHDFLLRDILMPGIQIKADLEYIVDLYLNGIQI